MPETSGGREDLGRTNENCRIYSEACLQLCKKLDVKVVDLWTRDDWLTACFTDGIHLTAEGSKIVVKEILKVLKEADWQPSLHWKSMPIEFVDNQFDLVSVDGKATVNVAETNFHWDIQWD